MTTILIILFVASSLTAWWAGVQWGLKHTVRNYNKSFVLVFHNEPENLAEFKYRLAIANEVIYEHDTKKAKELWKKFIN